MEQLQCITDARFQAQVALLDTVCCQNLAEHGWTSTDAGSTGQHYSWAPTSHQNPSDHLVIVLERQRHREPTSENTPLVSNIMCATSYDSFASGVTGALVLLLALLARGRSGSLTRFQTVLGVLVLVASTYGIPVHDPSIRLTVWQCHLDTFWRCMRGAEDEWSTLSF